MSGIGKVCDFLKKEIKQRNRSIHVIFWQLLLTGIVSNQKTFSVSPVNFNYLPVMGSFLVLRTGPITKQRDTKRVENTLNNAYTTTQKQTKNGFRNIQKTPQLWISGCSVINVYHIVQVLVTLKAMTTGRVWWKICGLISGVNHKKRSNITSSLTSKNLAFYFFVFNW